MQLVPSKIKGLPGRQKRALITGITGQDGSYLAEYLLELGYEVHGIIRRQSVTENQDSRIAGLPVERHYGDLTDPVSCSRLVRDIQPTEVYNLAAMSHVRVSFDVPAFTIQTNAMGVLNMLEAMRTWNQPGKFYQASSSEMFGNSIDSDGYQRETTPMVPVSPYGCAKVMGFNLTRHYRAAYGMYTCNGILFNHESPRRGSNFVTQKVVKTAVQISMGLADKLVLGNIDSQRDWGHSKDYVRAMHAMMNHGYPDDYVIATGETRSIRQLCELVFNELGLGNYQKYVEYDKRYTRPEELNVLRGDATKARATLDWEPEISYLSMVREMIEHWQGELG